MTTSPGTIPLMAVSMVAIIVAHQTLGYSPMEIFIGGSVIAFTVGAGMSHIFKPQRVQAHRKTNKSEVSSIPDAIKDETDE